MVSSKSQEGCMCNLSDKDIVSDILGTEKGMVKLYATAMVESSCTKMRALLNSQMTECAADQYDTFMYMSERGLYPVENATAEKVTTTKTKFKKKEACICK